MKKKISIHFDTSRGQISLQTNCDTLLDSLGLLEIGKDFLLNQGSKPEKKNQVHFINPDREVG